MTPRAALSASDRIADLDDGWDLHESRPMAGVGPAPQPATPAADLDDGWGLHEEHQQSVAPALQLVAVMAEPEPLTAEPAPASTPPAYAALAFSSDELAFFDAGEDLARPAPVERFDDLPQPPARGFWRRLLSRA